MKAVKRAGGQVAVEAAVKPWELPGWTREQGERLAVARRPRLQSARGPGRRASPAPAARAREAGPVAGAGARRRRGRWRGPVRHGRRGCARGQRRGRPAARGPLIRAAWLRAGRRAAGGRPRRRLAARTCAPRGIAARPRLRDHPQLRDGVAVAERLAAGEAPAQIKDSLRHAPAGRRALRRRRLAGRPRSPARRALCARRARAGTPAAGRRQDADATMRPRWARTRWCSPRSTR